MLMGGLSGAQRLQRRERVHRIRLNFSAQSRSDVGYASVWKRTYRHNRSFTLLHPGTAAVRSVRLRGRRSTFLRCYNVTDV